ncbi:F-box domain-containing protein [Mycena indigotica]|uniref:F-box domain-containing protein n=1 Tax=Mycena indigotica TaxID=2126181 RepID=A0A8H6W700_9AGAR|nr:F-box domain-containing protein [Mycena indigotica]KAF7303948.1 F-box domain-containing protein [Mycena indigotica]
MKYESIQAIGGFFTQDDPAADSTEIGAVPPRFGLLDASENRWTTLQAQLRQLNVSAGTAIYKLFIFGRHGQGFHNVAEDKYGTVAWDDYWSKLDGDGDLVWGPDPELTTIGKEQAVAVNELWKTERNAGIPLPESLYCSPMTRAIQTQQITFASVGSPPRALIMENCREEYGEHTCDKRHPKTHIQQRFPQFDIEDGFSEEDELWEPDMRETADHAAERARLVLEHVFAQDRDSLFISVTAHSGIINGFLRALGRPRYVLPTGGDRFLLVRPVFCLWLAGVLPIVIKATDDLVLSSTTLE